jgi:hypothetical protein
MANKQTDKLPVTERQAVRRIGLKLPEGQILKRAGAQSEEWQKANGRYFVIDTAKGTIVERSGDLESLARKLGAIENWERIDDTG